MEWGAGSGPQGEAWAATTHSFWCRWSAAETLAKAVEALVAETIKEAKLKVTGPLPPLLRLRTVVGSGLELRRLLGCGRGCRARSL